MYCLSCGRELLDGYLFCDYCGAPVPPLKEHNTKVSDDLDEQYFEPVIPASDRSSSSDNVDDISTKKAVLHCNKCGAELVEGSLFCDYCGTAVPKEKAKEEINPSDGISKQYYEPADSDTFRVFVPEQKEGIRCTTCGMELPDGSLFCDRCGSRIVDKVMLSEDTFAPVSSEDFEKAKQHIDVAKAPNIGIVQCRHCGELIDDDSIFCEMCGNKL